MKIAENKMVSICKAMSSERDDMESNGMETGKNHRRKKKDQTGDQTRSIFKRKVQNIRETVACNEMWNEIVVTPEGHANV